MGLFNRIVSFFDDWYMSAADAAVDDSPGINPATGLPMIGRLDAAGNPFGIDLASHHHRSPRQNDRHHEPHPTGSVFDDQHTGWHDPFPTNTGGGHDSWHA